MTTLKTLGLIALAGCSAQLFAADFEFDRPGEGLSTGITPVGNVAWEQGLPTARYSKSGDQTVTTLSADMLLRTGLSDDLELRLGWAGPTWTQVKSNGQTEEDDGLGDVSIGLKKAIDLDDDKLSMALLAEAIIATGNAGFTNEEDIYSLGSVVSYQYNDLVSTALTMRYEWQDSNWAVSAIPSLGYRITDRWSGYSELIYRKAESVDNQYALGTGVMYALNDRVQLDANVGVDLDGADRSYFSGLGFSVLF
ncbi:transporter [Acinetobacter lwoffii]|uniref:transporter n=1 Tax=Acinetobacter TaxID=469 RepID=UPI0020972C77|nr:transporter [Acinetobacter lwoffii]MCO8069739.1 transporter [Acinetobacter lwoffii]MCO8081653.1 transporter [Acinetobacter lwoffii]MCU4421851.1 transporter [Acinetobacter lwoffii]MCU4616555.1 transporter [Acinetobacter lwoffii]